MFPPHDSKPGGGKTAPKKPGGGPPKPGGGGPPFGGAGGPTPPPDPMGGGAALPFGGPGGPPPMGGPMFKPGQGMDPFTAMTQGLGPDILGAAGGMPQGGAGPLAPMGPGGLPIGGSMPHGGPGGGDMGGSDLLSALAGAIGGGDPYATNGQPPNLNVGTQDPNMGMEQLYQMLALAQLGVGGQPGSGPIGAGGSGVPYDMTGGMGQMVGM
jgi:hypothetical protein